MEMMLDKKQIWAIFLFEFRMSHKAAETTHNINNALAQELLTNTQCSGGSRSFAKETRALKMSLVTNLRKLTTTNGEPLPKLILLQLHEKLPKNLTSTFLWLFSIWSKLVRWKNLNNWVPHELTTNQKNCPFDFSIGLGYVTKSGF